jgi:hypothetical protein
MRSDHRISADQMMFLDCPAYLDHECTVRCGLPAEVMCRFIMRSTDGPLESAMIRCPAGHWFNGPVEFLTCENTQEHGAGVASNARHDRVMDSHVGPDGSRRFAPREVLAQHEQERSRPDSDLPAIRGIRPPVDHRLKPRRERESGCR